MQNQCSQLPHGGEKQTMIKLRLTLQAGSTSRRRDSNQLNNTKGVTQSTTSVALSSSHDRWSGVEPKNII